MWLRRLSARRGELGDFRFGNLLNQSSDNVFVGHPFGLSLEIRADAVPKHGDGDLANVGFHLSPSSPLMSQASRPPEREWTRGPVVITRTRTISSARGASFNPISIESKWLRT